jgi:hypothetical protein
MRGTVAGSAEAGFSHALDFHARMGTEAHAWPTTSSRRIPGHYLARAIQTLPDASTVIDTHMDAMIDVPGIGLVRVTAKRMKHKRAKSVHTSGRRRRRSRWPAHENPARSGVRSAPPALRLYPLPSKTASLSTPPCHAG